MTNEKPNNQLEIDLPESEAGGTFSNLVMINHSGSEFVMDFISVMPGVPKGRVVKRLILTPSHAKALLNALGDNIKTFEAVNGTIGEAPMGVPPLYQGPTPQA